MLIWKDFSDLISCLDSNFGPRLPTSLTKIFQRNLLLYIKTQKTMEGLTQKTKETLTPLSISNSYVPTLYDLRLDIDHLKPNFNGEVVIDLEKKDSSSSAFSLTLHASKLVVLGATLIVESGSSPLKTSYDRSKQQVTFTSEDMVGSQAKIHLKYMGQVNTIKTYQDSTQGLFKTNYLDSVSGKSNNYILATHFQPHFAKLVFPVIDELAIKAPIKLTLTTLNKFKVLSNSPLVSKNDISMSDKSEFEFEQTPPIAPSVFGFVIGDAEYLEDEITLESKKLPVRVYTAVGESSYASYALKLITKFLPVLQDLLGHPYPLSKLDFVAIPFLNDGAMENWGLITILSNQLLLEENSASFEAKHQLQQLVAHELVHQWLGNLVSFDDWNSLWLNESLATWLGNYVIYVSKINEGIDSYNYEISQIETYEKFLKKDCFIGEGDKLTIPAIASHMAMVDTGLYSTTSSIFDTQSYEKGIILLTMVANVLQAGENQEGAISYSQILKGFSKVISTFKHKTIKQFDIWNILNEFTSIDLLSFFHSWTRYAGFPLVTVKAAGNQIVFEQHIYLYNLQPQQIQSEDQPFHIPLLINIRDDKGVSKLVNILMTDRTLKLDIPISQFVGINHQRGGYYRTVYSSEIVEKCIVPGIKQNKLSPTDIITILHDYNVALKTSGDFGSLISIYDSFITQEKVDYEVLKVALGYLETINHTLIHFSDYTSFQTWLQQFITKLYANIGSWENLVNLTSTYSSSEMQVRNSILQLGLDNAEFQELGLKLFKNFLNSGINKSFTPRELLMSIFNLAISNANQKTYKRIMEFVKNSNSSILKNTNVELTELQTIAVSSLSFTKNDELLGKTLNFVMTNIDSKMIELALIGFQYKTSRDEKLRIFNWYRIHYDQWTNKSLRKGSDWSKQLKITLQNITNIVLGFIMQHDQELLQLREKFLSSKLQLPEHGLKKLVEEMNERNEENVKLGKLATEYFSSFKA